MTADPITTLREVGKRFDKRVSTTNLFDTNVCAIPPESKPPWELFDLPDVLRHELKFTIAGHRVALRANRDFIVLDVAENLDVDVCSINRRDRVFQLVQNPHRVPGFTSLPVYSRRPDTDLRRLLNAVALATALRVLQLTKNESLHIYGNGVVLYLQPPSTDAVVSALETACKLVGALPKANEIPDLRALPAQFKDLLGLIPDWALRDDSERSEMLEDASREKLQSFVAAVSPHIAAINQYLDSFGDEEPSEAAAYLGALAECCLEAQACIGESPERG